MHAKNILLGIIAFLCIGTMIAGKIHWNEKINAAGDSLDENITQKIKEETKEDELASLTRHLPPELTAKIETATAEREPINILAIGSKAVSEGHGTWTNLLQSNLDRAYGKAIFNVEVESFGDDLSINVVNQKKYTSALEKRPDIVLLEPFVLNDNGKVAIEHTLESTEHLITEFLAAKADTIIILQPPNPIHQGIHYPGQVQALKNYAETNDILYLDHWQAWPDTESDDMLAYVDESNRLPSEKGHHVWGTYIANYFTGEDL